MIRNRLSHGKKHSHESEEVEIQVQGTVRGIKRRTQSHPSEPLVTIFASEVENINNEEVLCNRIQNRHRPVNTNTLEDSSKLVIPGQKTGTYFNNMT